MKERPILFSAPMVRAILEGRKTMTRREFKTRNGGVQPNHNDIPGMRQILRECRHGQPGDRLWVRETWGVVSHTWDASGDMTDWTPDRPATHVVELPFGKGYYTGHVIYAADGKFAWAGDDDGGGESRSAWHPSIHMPRSASRITLEITGVRVERLNDITEDDVVREGVDFAGHSSDVIRDYSADERFSMLWTSINGHGSWNANPWVWVIEFKRIQEKA